MAICELNVSHLFITYILSTKISHCKTFFKNILPHIISIDKNSLLTHFIPFPNKEMFWGSTFEVERSMFDVLLLLCLLSSLSRASNRGHKRLALFAPLFLVHFCPSCIIILFSFRRCYSEQTDEEIETHSGWPIK